MKKLTLTLICSSLIFFSACSWMDTKAYYATHPTPAEDVEFLWGEPLRVKMLGNGTVKWIYLLEDQLEDWVSTEHYFLIRDGRVVDAGIN